VYADDQQGAYFCEYVESESGDNPPYAVVTTGTRKSVIDARLATTKDYRNLSRLKPGTAITFDLNVTYGYDESGGGMQATSFMTAFALNPEDEGPPGVCRQPGEESLDYTGVYILGIFCGYEPGEGGAPGQVSVQAGKGLQRMAVSLDAAKTAQLASIARETFFYYDLQVKRQFSPDGSQLPPIVSMTDIRQAAGEPAPGGCSRSTLF
jgi:hypothetical protein